MKEERLEQERAAQRKKQAEAKRKAEVCIPRSWYVSVSTF